MVRRNFIPISNTEREVKISIFHIKKMEKKEQTKSKASTERESHKDYKRN